MLMVTSPQYRRPAPAPAHHQAMQHHQAMGAMALPPGSMSRTLQYKKITKPLLERKRRARINRCLDELKELMTGAFEAEGENVAKLEKADILELTVRHLHKLHEAGRLLAGPTHAHDSAAPAEAVAHATRFQAGFSRCAAEAVRYLLTAPGIDAELGRRLVRHLAARCLGPAPGAAPGAAPAPAPGAAPPPPAAHTAPLSVRVASPAPSDSSDSGVSPCASSCSVSPAMSSTSSRSSQAVGLLMPAPAHDDESGPVWRPW